MIILRNNMFSSKKTDEETKYQKSQRRGLASAVGILGAGTSAVLGTNIVDNKYDKELAKILKLSKEHLYKIDADKNTVNKRILGKTKEILKDPRVQKEGKVGARKVELASRNLIEENNRRALKKIIRLSKATERLTKRLGRKHTKAQLISGIGATGLGLGAAIGTSNIVKKRNKKINRIRRHIDDN